MKSSNKSGVHILVGQCLAHGVKHIVCSPGSRNAPLVIAFDQHPSFTCYVVHDERSAAFFALGMIQQLNAPVAICCTSGSAPLNYYPAVAEAYYQCLPLVIITADRPLEWINQGDGQTIMQRGVFGEHIRYTVDLKEHPTSSMDYWYAERELATAFSEGMEYWKGPIHINIGFTEPLYETLEINPGSARKINLVKGSFSFSGRNELLCMEAMKFPKKMILCGQLVPDLALQQQLHQLAQDGSFVVLVENTANLVDPRFVHCIDRTLNAISDEEIDAFAPDLLITIGGAIVSKKIKAFLRKVKPKQHWKIGFEFPYMDTYQCLTHSFQTEPAVFFHQLVALPYERVVSNYGSRWKQLDYTIQDKLPSFYENLAFCDLKVFETVLDYLPEDSNLHMANSSVVRYCQLFDPIRSVNYWSNRGTSGIDGSTSTAVGAAAVGVDKCHILITGDVSFFYDSNALWNKHLSKNLRIILINNNGGNIFRIIPGPDKSEQLERYFEAVHTTDAQNLCAGFGIEYTAIGSSEELEDQMLSFYTIDSDKPKLLEIFTDREMNPVKLNEYFLFFEKL